MRTERRSLTLFAVLIIGTWFTQAIAQPKVVLDGTDIVIGKTEYGCACIIHGAVKNVGDKKARKVIIGFDCPSCVDKVRMSQNKIGMMELETPDESWVVWNRNGVETVTDLAIGERKTFEIEVGYSVGASCEDKAAPEKLKAKLIKWE